MKKHVHSECQNVSRWRHVCVDISCVYAVSEAAAGLSAEDRRKYAEQVTKQFWQAVGGNADEFEGLSSDSD